MFKAKIIGVVLLVFILGGCGSKNIQELTYVVSLGIDYDIHKKQYIIYTMGLDFSGVAKMEGPKPSKAAPVYIGKSRGHTISEAISNLQKSTQPQLYLRHTKTILLSDNALKKKLKDILPDLGRIDFFRESIYLFGTKNPIKDIFLTRALFSYPANYTILLKPQGSDWGNYLQNFEYRQFISRFYEPVGAAYIPSVGIDENRWKKDTFKYPSMKLKGVYFYENQAYAGYKPIDRIKGIRWRENKESKNNYALGNKKKPHTVVRVSTSRMKIKVLDAVDKPAFAVYIKADADVLESLRNVPEDKIKKDLEKKIKKEIETAFKDGLDMKADILRLGTVWFRGHKSEFVSYVKRNNGDSFYLDKNSIKILNVKVHIHSTYNYKSETRSNIWDTKSIYSK